MLKNLLIITIIALLTAGLTIYFDHSAPGVSAPISAPEEQAEGMPAPDFTITDRAGKTHKLSDFKGKKVILNFWASWCPPCIKEFPDLLSVATADPDNTILLALSSDIDDAAMNRFLSRMEKEHPDAMSLPGVIIALDDGAAVTQGLFQTYQLPETILIDTGGIMRHKIPGANWTKDDMEKLLSGL
ncbi:MAG: TlpA family protein disulfide reductase [Alphaproteobacteria bacterium]|nr:TlpA family protein disulfide reductase [Alphaproteobacteria bacterium]MCD8569965.1 TlpA family protein disulfide reductase [Alphaproteobacteria bacterium]